MSINKPLHSGFPEIGGAGEIIYNSVRFTGYTLQDDQSGQYFCPIADDEHPPISKIDYNLKGHEILFSLANLHKQLNHSEEPIDSRKLVTDWCNNNIHPFNIRLLAELCSSEETKDELDWEEIRRTGSFSFEDFRKNLYNLACTTDYYYALKSARRGRDTNLARNLYYEGYYEDGFPFFEKLRSLPDDEYLKRVDDDYPTHIRNIMDFVPPFRMSLQMDGNTDKIGLYASIDSVFDIAWFALARIIATDAPPQDSDDDTPLYTNTPYICCKACGTYVPRSGLRQQYCMNQSCQNERNRKKQQDHYYRQKLKKSQK